MEFPSLMYAPLRVVFMIAITVQYYVIKRYMAIFETVTELSFERKHSVIHTTQLFEFANIVLPPSNRLRVYHIVGLWTGLLS